MTTGFVTPDWTKIVGCDISDWDGNVNFQVFADHGGKFAIIKAIDGTVPAKYWKANNQRAIDANLINGAYGWLYPDRCVPVKSQAKAFLDLILSNYPELLSLPPVIDFEWTRYNGEQANPNYADLDKWVTEFNRLSEERIDKPILYSAPGYINMLGRMPNVLREKFSGFWWASYGGLSYPTGFDYYDIHQFTPNGDALALCPGDRNKKELDLNYMTEEFWTNFAGDTPPPAEETGETMATLYGTVITTTTLNIRSGPGTAYADIGDLHYGDKLEASEQIGGWWKLTKINGVPVASTETYAYANSGLYIRTDASPQPEPTFPPEIGITINGVTKLYIVKP